jgi:hypothetical protein
MSDLPGDAETLCFHVLPRSWIAIHDHDRRHGPEYYSWDIQEDMTMYVHIGTLTIMTCQIEFLM